MTSSEKRKRQKEKAGAKRCGIFELSLHKVPYFWQTITFLILMVVTFVPLGHVVMKKIPKNTNIETFKLFAAEHYIISSGFIGRFLHLCYHKNILDFNDFSDDIGCMHMFLFGDFDHF